MIPSFLEVPRPFELFTGAIFFLPCSNPIICELGLVRSLGSFHESQLTYDFLFFVLFVEAYHSLAVV